MSEKVSYGIPELFQNLFVILIRALNACRKTLTKLAFEMIVFFSNSIAPVMPLHDDEYSNVIIISTFAVLMVAVII